MNNMWLILEREYLEQPIVNVTIALEDIVKDTVQQLIFENCRLLYDFFCAA